MIWRLLLFEIIVVAVIAAVWLLAPMVGIESVLWRVLIILALILPPIALVIWKLLRERRDARGLESAIKDQAQAHQQTVRPDRQAEIEALNEVFAESVAALRGSKLGGGGGRALYALPWYMIIGPPAVGKSTALLRSGLKFPYTSGDRKAVKGVGGTRNCDWWFAEQAILLDTAGRYTSEDDDLDEWTAFLRMVKRYRRRRPLNGLLVAASIGDILTASADEVEDQAAQIRSRIDQVIGELDLALPIYVLITKCDLLSGFVEYFADLKQSTRSQVLGFTVPLTRPGTDVEALFSERMDQLTERLQQRALVRLAAAKDQHRAQVFQFPLQFAAAKDPLSLFLGRLLASNQYQEAPRLRGVYFCSGTQEGRPVDRVMAAMTRALGLRDLGREGFAEQTTKKSYFLRDVFTEVIFPDRELVSRTPTSELLRRRLGLVGAIGAALLSLGAIAAYSAVFSNNRQLVATTLDLARRSRLTTPDDPRQVTSSLEALDRLGARVDELRGQAEGGAPWSHGLGFYAGDELLAPTERVYIKRMRQAFVLPAGSELEATLIDVAAATDEPSKGATQDFELLKAYLMVTEPKRLDLDFATNVLRDQWAKRLHPEVTQRAELLERNIRRYLKLLSQGRARWLERDENLIANVRHALRRRDTWYQALCEDASRLRPFQLRDALQGRVQTVISSKHEVPACYTRNGWQRHVRSRLAKQLASRGSKFEPWVLGEAKSHDLTARLRKRYFEQYIATWERFLEGLSVEPGSSPQESLALLERLTSAPPLYQLLFEAVVYNTELPLVELKGGGELLKHAGRRLGKAGRAISAAQRAGLGKAVSQPKGPVEIAFLPLRELVEAGKGMDGRVHVSGLSQYTEQLALVQDQLGREVKGEGSEPGALEKVVAEARRVTQGVLATLPGAMRRRIGPLFYTPLLTAASDAKQARASRSERSFSGDLCTAYKESLAGRYPFAQSLRDALMQDVIQFFSTTGTVWSYYDKNLKLQLPRRGDRFQPAPDQHLSPQIVGFFNQAWQVTRSLFPLGSDQPSMRFEVRVRPVVLTGGSYQVSEIALEVEGKQRIYRNGPVEQWTFEWRGNGQRSRLLVRGAAGLREEISYDGDWSLRRLLGRAKVRKRGSWHELQWSLKGGEIRVPMEIRPSRSYDPFFRPLRLSCK